MVELSEEELDGCMARLSRGERAAFDPLFRALHPRAVRFARLTMPSDQAADCAQSILLKVFARASEFQPGRPVLAWFYAVAANEVHTHRRRMAALRARTVGESLAEAMCADDDPELVLLRGELERAIERALASLDDASAEAIASVLYDRPRPSVEPSTFRKRVSRARARLRLLLGGLYAK